MVKYYLSGAMVRIQSISRHLLLPTVAAFAVLPALAHAQVDPLLRPALLSTKAASVAQLAIARAGKRLVSVGVRGVILYSDDSGVSWRQAIVPVSVSLTQVRFTTPEHGWAVGHGGVILHSVDGGQTWTKVLDGAQAAALILESVKATNEEGDAKPAAAQRLVDDGADKPWLDIQFEGERGIVVGAYGIALNTEDGGKTWHSLFERLPNPDGWHLYGVARSGDHIVIVGEKGVVMSSNDGGQSFSNYPTPNVGTYFGVLMLDKERWLAYGMVGNAYMTSDGGVTWIKVDTEDAESASLTHAERLPDGTLLLSTSGGGLLISKDQGLSFHRFNAKQPGPVLDFALATDTSLLVVGLRGTTRLSGIISGAAR